MRRVLALLLLAMLLQFAVARPKKSTKAEKEKVKHKTASKKSSPLKPEVGKTQNGTKKQMLGGMPGGGEEQIDGLGNGAFGGGGLGGEMEGMPTGMGAGAEPLGFGALSGGPPIGQLAGAIPGISNPQAEDSRLEDGPRGTPIGLMGLNGAPPNGEESLMGGVDQAPIGRPNYFARQGQALGPGVDGADKLNVEGPSFASFAPGLGGSPNEYTGEESAPINALPAGNMVSPVINGPLEDNGPPPQQGITGMSNSEIQDNQLVAGQEAGQQDVGEEAASIAKTNFNDNVDVGAAIKEMDKVGDAREAMSQPEMNDAAYENPSTVQQITNSESAELRQAAMLTATGGKPMEELKVLNDGVGRPVEDSQVTLINEPVGRPVEEPKAVLNEPIGRPVDDSKELTEPIGRPMEDSKALNEPIGRILEENEGSSPGTIKDVEATTMTGGQVMMGVQGGMKRHNLKKVKATKKTTKSSKSSKKHT